MPIDPNQVRWDSGGISPDAVKWDGPPARDDSTVMSGLATGIGNGVIGAVRGVKDVLDTAALGPAWVYDKLTGADRNLSSLVTGQPAGEFARIKAMNEAGKREFAAGMEDSTMASIGRVGGNILGTLPVGGALGAGLRAAAPATGAAAPVVNALVNAVATGGMRTGSALPAAADMGIRLGGGALSGAATAGLVDPSSATTGALIGGALPPIVRGAGAAGSAIRSSLIGPGVSPEVAQLATRAKELGINIPADRLIDSKPINALAAGLNYVPFSGRTATEDAMNSQLNRALSRTFGQDSSNVTQALRQADNKLGGEFDRVLKGNKVRVDGQFVDELANVANNANQTLGSDGAAIINRQVDEILAKAGTGEIDGQAAYNLKRVLDQIGKRNTPEAYNAIELKQSLMGALNRSLGPEQAQAFATTRQQYGTMLNLEKLAKNGVDGELSVARVANMKNIRDPKVQELADIAAQFVKAREGQHGAAQRAFVGLGAGLLGGPQGLAATSAAGRAANGLLNSDSLRNYLLNGPGQPSAIQGLLSEGAYRTSPLLGAYSASLLGQQ